jgi:hypothetical protein
MAKKEKVDCELMVSCAWMLAEGEEAYQKRKLKSAASKAQMVLDCGKVPYREPARDLLERCGAAV